MRRPLLRIAAVAALLTLATVLGSWALRSRDPPAREPLALFTSLPIYWAEASDPTAVLRDPAPPHWARAALERRWRLRPLDALDGVRGLASERRLLMVQPRPLSPAENVAIDDWVVGGGRLLLFADPALTAESAFAIGDRRRPQDVVLLSPILARWGLELRFDEGQPPAGRELPLGAGAVLPVRLAGSFALLPAKSRAACTLSPDGAIARCRIGRGVLVAVADAALFEPNAGASRGEHALAVLTREAFGG